MKTPDEFIDKYLSLFAAHGCHQASLKHFMETGKASGTFRSALHEMMTAYASQQLSALQQENETLKATFEEFKRAMAKGSELYAHLKFDDQEFTPYQLALQENEKLRTLIEKAIEDGVKQGWDMEAGDAPTVSGDSNFSSDLERYKAKWLEENGIV